ncbi:MAG: GTPase HflX [Lachnospiraceae bacterium]|nr:GTPase HflX [Lachnospiraceae bacterium]
MLDRFDVTKSERYILVGVATRDTEETRDSLTELGELIDTAGGEVLDYVVQNLKNPEPGTYIGKGKAEELRELVDELDATGVVCDDELSPAQIRNLSDLLDCKVIDRTILILDIFAAHATTSEGKLQVEMAQLKYRSSRLLGMGRAMSRLGGGIGTRGPGESKLETDRRLIQKRIGTLKTSIDEMQKIRETTRKKREANTIPVVAIVGYTNAGKSTLLNYLTDANILSEDKLFATLDPTTRKCKLPSGEEILLTDTVGFINKLPHNLIDAFKSTLEEAAHADLILHIADSSDKNIDMHLDVVYQTLHDLKITGKPVITAFNKIDKVEDAVSLTDNKAETVVRMSAKTGEGVDKLLEVIQDELNSMRVLVDCVLPYTRTGDAEVIRKGGQLISMDYEGDGIHIKAYIPKALGQKLGVIEKDNLD